MGKIVDKTRNPEDVTMSLTLKGSYIPVIVAQTDDVLALYTQGKQQIVSILVTYRGTGARRSPPPPEIIRKVHAVKEAYHAPERLRERQQINHGKAHDTMLQG